MTAATPTCSAGMREKVEAYARDLLQREALRAVTPRRVREMSPHAEVRAPDEKAWIAVDCAANQGRAELLGAIAAIEAERDALRSGIVAVLADLDRAIGKAHRRIWNEPLEFFGEAGSIAAKLRALATGPAKERA